MTLWLSPLVFPDGQDGQITADELQSCLTQSGISGSYKRKNNKRSYVSTPATGSDQRGHVFGLSTCPSHSQENLEGFSSYLVETIPNCLDVGGWRSRVKVTGTSCSCEHDFSCTQRGPELVKVTVTSPTWSVLTMRVLLSQPSAWRPAD